MNRVLDGVRYRVASGTHNVPRNTSKGDVGVVAHWAKSRFDNLTIADRPLR